MASPLQIYDARERRIVRVADVLLAPLAWLRRRRQPRPIHRILILRLERIGDLVMVLDAIRDVRTAWPDAEIDLAVGSWNAPIAELVPDIHRVLIADAPWLARGRQGQSWPALVTRALKWRAHRYDLVLNFEPDIRSNLLAWLTRAPVRMGYASGGGGALLTTASVYDQTDHVAVNAARLVGLAAGRSEVGATDQAHPRLIVPDEARRRAREMLGSFHRPLVGVHASGGRESKQWHLDRFAAAARQIAVTHGATIVLTGATTDRPLVDAVRATLGDTPVVDLCGSLNLVELAAVLAEIDVLVTGDTGPMHLAAAVGTPLVALFGPSNPVRYGPLSGAHRILRVDLWCSPCGQVRLPPERCRGHVPECLDRISVDTVVQATTELLETSAGRHGAVG